MTVPGAVIRGRARTAEREPRPDERILQLLLMLIAAERPVSRAEIFAAIPSYRTRLPAAGERKFERDKKDLLELGVPIELAEDEPNTYQVERSAYELPELPLADDERAALALAAEALATWDGLPYRDLVEDALRKLSYSDALPAPTRAPSHIATALPEPLARASPAQDGRRADARGGGAGRVTLRYRPNDDEPTERVVDPYALVYSGGDWLLIGHCHLRNAPRTFRVDRVDRLKVGGKPGTPDFERPRGWDLIDVRPALAVGGPGGRFGRPRRRARRESRALVGLRRGLRAGRHARGSSRRGRRELDACEVPLGQPRLHRHARPRRRRQPSRGRARRATRARARHGGRGGRALRRDVRGGEIVTPLGRRLRRVLFLIPYVSKHDYGVPLAELATILGTTTRELEREVGELTMVGVPEGGPDEFIDIHVQGKGTPRASSSRRGACCCVLRASRGRRPTRCCLARRRCARRASPPSTMPSRAPRPRSRARARAVEPPRAHGRRRCPPSSSIARATSAPITSPLSRRAVASAVK